MGSHNNFIGRSGLQNICVVVPVCLIKSGSRIHQNYVNDEAEKFLENDGEGEAKGQSFLERVDDGPEGGGEEERE